MQTETIFFPALIRRTDYETHPINGTFYSYTHYRDAIAEDCQFRCVYCDSHEDEVGGREAMALDHFRPWNKGFGVTGEKKFEHLQHEPANLVHSCGVCNRFKWAHWPTEDPDKCYDDEKGWIDPFEESRADFLGVGNDGSVFAKKVPGQYHINKLRLNRPLLKRQRELRLLMNNLGRIEEQFRVVLDREKDTGHAQTAATGLRLVEAIKWFCGR